MIEALKLLWNTPAGTAAVVLGMLLLLVAIVGRIDTPWLKIELKPWQRVLLGLAGLGVASLSLLSAGLTTNAERASVPYKDLMVIEQYPAQTLHDGTFTFYLRSPDVHRVVGDPDDSKRFAELEFSTKENFTPMTQVNVYPGMNATVILDGHGYSLSFRKMGAVDAQPHEKQDHPWDFVLLSIERER